MRPECLVVSLEEGILVVLLNGVDDVVLMKHLDLLIVWLEEHWVFQVWSHIHRRFVGFLVFLSMEKLDLAIIRLQEHWVL